MAGEIQQDPTEATASDTVPDPSPDSAEPPDGPNGSDGSDGDHACFSSLDVTRVRRALAVLHEQVAFRRGRVEIKRRGCDDVCVMISKAELEALESALEIMAASQEYKAMCETLSQVAAATGGYVTA